MTVQVLHVWVCDNCGLRATYRPGDKRETVCVSDLPPGWEKIPRPPERIAPYGDKDMDLCADCVKRQRPS